jgi:hypothetical protein
MLHAHGYKDKDLAREVQQLLDEKDPTKILPNHIHQTVDAIRNLQGEFTEGYELPWKVPKQMKFHPPKKWPILKLEDEA